MFGLGQKDGGRLLAAAWAEDARHVKELLIGKLELLRTRKAIYKQRGIDYFRPWLFLITDGLPTAHFEGQMLYLLYPPDPRTESATLREGLACQREGITINLFLLPSWSQTEEDVRFAFRLAESTSGRVFFTAGRDLDRYVVWDYLNRRRELVN